MPLIIYPDANADSFISVADATTTIEQFTLDSALWTVHTIPEQEALLRIAYQDIIGNSQSPLPTPLPACVPNAQALMAVWDSKYGISSDTRTNSQVKKNKVGQIEQEFFYNRAASKTASRVPDTVRSCLEQIGYSFPKMGQLHLGRM